MLMHRNPCAALWDQFGKELVEARVRKAIDHGSSGSRQRGAARPRARSKIMILTLGECTTRRSRQRSNAYTDFSDALRDLRTSLELDRWRGLERKSDTAASAADYLLVNQIRWQSSTGTTLGDRGI